MRGTKQHHSDASNAGGRLARRNLLTRHAKAWSIGGTVTPLGGGVGDPPLPLHSPLAALRMSPARTSALRYAASVSFNSRVLMGSKGDVEDGPSAAVAATAAAATEVGDEKVDFA